MRDGLHEYFDAGPLRRSIDAGLASLIFVAPAVLGAKAGFDDISPWLQQAPALLYAGIGWKILYNKEDIEMYADDYPHDPRPKRTMAGNASITAGMMVAVYETSLLAGRGLAEIVRYFI